MNIEKSRLISEAAPHLNAYQGTINGNEFATIVPVIPGHIGGRETNIVSAKALHKALGVGKDFSTWITDRISEYNFTIGHDYSIHKTISPNLGKSPSGAAYSKIKHSGRPGKDYLLSVGMAKELAMIERNDQGRAIRRYFIQCEEELQRSVPEIAARYRRHVFSLWRDSLRSSWRCAVILNEPAAQKEAFNLASLLTNVNPYNLIKPKVVNDYLLSIVMAKELAKISLNLSKPDIHALKKSLPLCGNTVYGYSAPAKSGVGIGVLQLSTAHNRAKCGFFVCVARLHPSMVGWARASKDAPVSVEAGTPTSFSSPPAIGVFGGDYIHHSTEAAAMLATTPTQKPQFIWIIAAVRRDMPTITAKIHHIAAETEQEARRILARDHVCFFAGRIRLEVAA